MSFETGLHLTLWFVGVLCVLFLWFVGAKVIRGLSSEPSNQTRTAQVAEQRHLEGRERARREAVHLVNVEEAAAQVRQARQQARTRA